MHFQRFAIGRDSLPSFVVPLSRSPRYISAAAEFPWATAHWLWYAVAMRQSDNAFVDRDRCVQRVIVAEFHALFKNDSLPFGDNRSANRRIPECWESRRQPAEKCCAALGILQFCQARARLALPRSAPVRPPSAQGFKRAPSRRLKCGLLLGLDLGEQPARRCKVAGFDRIWASAFSELILRRIARLKRRSGLQCLELLGHLQQLRTDFLRRNILLADGVQGGLGLPDGQPEGIADQLSGCFEVLAGFPQVIELRETVSMACSTSGDMPWWIVTVELMTLPPTAKPPSLAITWPGCASRRSSGEQQP